MAYLYPNLDKDMMCKMAIIAGNAGHEMRNILAVAVSPHHPELQSLDQLSGQLEGQCRAIASHLTCNLDTKDLLLQAYRKSSFISRILKELPQYCTSETELSGLHKDQMKEVLTFQLALLTQFDALLNDSYSKLLKRPNVEDGRANGEVLCSVHGDKWTIDLDFEVPHLEGKHPDDQIVDCVAHLDEISRRACNDAHQIQNIASIHNKKGTYQPRTQKLINLAGQIENNTRNIRGALSRARQNVPVHPNPQKMLENIINQCTNQLTNVENTVCEIQEVKVGIHDSDTAIAVKTKSIWNFVVSAGTVLRNQLTPNFLLLP